jgi:hypothetical protein
LPSKGCEPQIGKVFAFNNLKDAIFVERVLPGSRPAETLLARIVAKTGAQMLSPLFITYFPQLH